MGIVDLNIIFDRHDSAYTPGQMMTGRVELVLDKSKTIKMIKLKFKGRAYVEWSESEDETDFNGKSSRKRTTYQSNEEYLNHKIILDQRDEENLTLGPGKYTYLFEVILPKNIPSTFAAITGRIYYFAQLKIIIPGQINKIKKEYFKVKNYLNLNDYPELKAPTAVQKNKKFYHYCCIPYGRLTICARIPKSAFVTGETVSVLLEVNNESNVAVRKINAHLIRKAEFRTTGKKNYNRKTIKSYELNRGVDSHTSNTWTENVVLPQEDFPYLENCHIIILKHELQVEAQAEGMHCDIDLFIPITIGDIPFSELEIDHRDVNHFLMPNDYEEQGTSNLAFTGFKDSEELVLAVSSLHIIEKNADDFESVKDS